MKFKSYLLSWVALSCMCSPSKLAAQENLTDVLLRNADFNSHFSYGITTSGNIAGDVLNEVEGWTKDMTSTYTVAGTFAYGSGATFNNSSAIPTSGYNNSEGGAFAFTTGWGMELRYKQDITLPKGKYAIATAYYNAGTATVGKSLVGWSPVTGAAVLSAVNSFPVRAWRADTLYLELTETTQGAIQIGFAAIEGTGSANQAKLLIDYVHIYAYGVDKSLLRQTIEEGQALYGEGSGVDAADLFAVIAAAQEVLADEEATMVAVVTHTHALNEAIYLYNLKNVSDENPIDKTELIENPSFESSTTGWVVDGFVTQTNTSFAYKSGTTYIERWVSSGSRVGNSSVEQTLSNLDNGAYTLRVAAAHVQQSATATAQTGMTLFADEESLPVTFAGEYDLDFVVLNNQVTLGARVVSATGNWVMCDNFRLLYKGFDLNVLKAELQRVIDLANGLKGQKMQNSVLALLTAAIGEAESALLATTDGALSAPYTALKSAIVEAEISVAAYQTLQTKIEAAQVVASEGLSQGGDEFLLAIQVAQAMGNNLEATLQELTDAVAQLDIAILAYRVANGTGTAPRVTTNPRFARGATAAFGRLSVTGSGILERGFCWATHPEPTVLDSRSTKTFTNNGLIYHLQGLQPSTVYYMRAYAINNTYAVGYGEVIKVVTIPKGTISYTLEGSVTGAPGHHERIASAMAEAVDYWNNLTSIQGHHLSVSYNAGTPTAEASYGGYLRFGPNSSYQRTGTAMHEMGHTIGVGQHSIWYGPNSVLRAGGTTGTWLGYRTSEVVQFFENSSTAVLTGDAVHMWPYGINGAHEDSGSEILYIANSLIHQALGEDGLPPTNSYLATRAYLFTHNDTVKYYLKNEDEASGRDQAYLMEGANSELLYRQMTGAEAQLNDSAAWYLTFNPVSCYYQIRNAATGKYFSYNSSRVRLMEKETLLATENFQLKGSRVTTTIGSGSTALTTRGFWMIRPTSSNSGTCLNINGTATNVTAYNRANSSTKQRWIILSGEEVDKYDEAIGVTSVTKPTLSQAHIYTQHRTLQITNLSEMTDITIYDLSGRVCHQAKQVANSHSQTLQKGVYLITLRARSGKEVHKVTIR